MDVRHFCLAFIFQPTIRLSGEFDNGKISFTAADFYGVVRQAKQNVGRHLVIWNTCQQRGTKQLTSCTQLSVYAYVYLLDEFLSVTKRSSSVQFNPASRVQTCHLGAQHYPSCCGDVEHFQLSNIVVKSNFAIAFPVQFFPIALRYRLKKSPSSGCRASSIKRLSTIFLQRRLI